MKLKTVKLAVVNFSQTVGELSSHEMRGFLQMTPAVYNQAASTPGHVASARPQDDREDLSFFERDWGHWGRFVVPNYYVGGTAMGDIWEASALSLWEDLPSLYHFVYTGIHLRAVRRRASWFTRMQYPNYAMWWTRVWPTWAEGAQRLELQHSKGECFETFTFRNLFDPEGTRISATKIIAAAGSECSP